MKWDLWQENPHNVSIGVQSPQNEERAMTALHSRMHRLASKNWGIVWLWPQSVSATPLLTWPIHQQPGTLLHNRTIYYSACSKFGNYNLGDSALDHQTYFPANTYSGHIVITQQVTIFPVARWLLCLLCTQCAKLPPQVSGRLYPDIPYGRNFWRADILADCWNYDIWQN